MARPQIDRFLKLTADRGASDFHISAGRPPMLRISGQLDSLRYRILDDEEIERLVRPIIPDNVWHRYLATGDSDCAYEVEGVARFRVNLFRQERGLGAVFRVVPSDVITLEQLGLPTALKRLANLRTGLVLVTGPTGSGKSTTLAAIIDLINNSRASHIVTIEDPIEFVHQNRRALISQREVGQHAGTFSEALKSALREDPDVVLIGELRDREVMEIGLDAADAGLLVFSTLHTNSAAKTLDRIVGAFPADRRDGISRTLAGTLRGVVSQQLVQRVGGGRVAAVEILFDSPSLSSAIREGKTHKIPDIIRTGRSRGMLLLDDNLRSFVEQGIITAEVAYERSLGKDSMEKWLVDRGHEMPEDVKLPEPGAKPTAAGPAAPDG